MTNTWTAHGNRKSKRLRMSLNKEIDSSTGTMRNGNKDMLFVQRK